MTLQQIADVLNLFPEVRWDRCLHPGGEDDAEFVAYGWIDRDDGRSDFLLIRTRGEGVGFTTSSAALSRDFGRRLHGTVEHHVDCERVEDVFGLLVANKVELSR